MQTNSQYRPDSIYSHLRTQLYDSGLFENQADAVLANLVARKDNSMSGRWNDRVSAYPPAMLGVLWVSAKAEALKWIDSTMPLHWARPLFMPDVEKTIQKMESAETDPQIKCVGDRLKLAKRLALKRPQTPKDALVARRRLSRRQKAFDRLEVTS
jgi:hypothetical protein